MKMKTVNELEFWGTDLRSRIRNLEIIQSHELFGQEVARLIDRISEQTEFSGAISALELEESRVNAEASEILRPIFDEAKKIWEELKKLKISNDKLPKNAVDLKMSLESWYKNPQQRNALDFYHATRMLIEELAGTQYSDKIHPFYTQVIGNRMPQLAGKIHELFVAYSNKDDEIKYMLQTTQWGAWASLRNVVAISRQHNPNWQLKEWFSLFKHEETLVNFNRVADYLIDFSSLTESSKLLKFDDHPLAKYSVPTTGFSLDKDKLNLLEYGSIPFTPLKTPNPKAGRIGQGIIRLILNSGTKGILSSDIEDQQKSSDNDVYSHVTAFNRRCKNFYNQKTISAYVEIIHYGGQGAKKFQFIIIPRQLYYDETLRKDSESKKALHEV